MFSLLLFVALAVFARAAETGHGHHGAMKAGAAPQAELGAQAAFDQHGVLWAVHKVTGHIAVSRSADLGRSWSSPVLVTREPEATDSGGDARPKIVLGREGEIYVSWTRPLSKPFTGEIRFSRSLDGGRTFLPPQVVHRDRQEITHRFDALAVNAQGQLFVAWVDKRDLVVATKAGTPYRGAAIYFAVSDDRGATFRGDFKVADHSCECCRLALASSANGEVVLLWRHIFEPNIRDHASARLRADGTASPVTRVSFEDWRIDACPHHGPAIATDGNGEVQAAWFSMAPRLEGIFYGRIGRGDEPAVNVGGLTAEHADLAIAGEHVALAWKEFDGERSRLRGRFSTDGGYTWIDVELASGTGLSDHPRVLAFNGHFYAFWNTRTQPLSVTPFP